VEDEDMSALNRLCRWALGFTTLGLMLAGTTTAIAQGGAPPAAATPAVFAPGEVLVVFAPGTARAAVDQVFAKHGTRVLHYYQYVDVYLVAAAPGKTEADTAAALSAEAGVQAAHLNYEVRGASHLTTPNDPEYPQQWGLNNTGTNLVGAPQPHQPGLAILNAVGVIDADIDAPQAWEHQTDCHDIVVAVLDSGVDFTHPDFAGNIWTNPGEIAGDGIDNDGNGVIDDVNGANFAAYERHAENVAANGMFDAGEAIYLDVDGSRTVTAVDVLLAGPAQVVNTVLINFRPSPPLPPPPPGGPPFERHAENVAADGSFNAGESIYNDVDNSLTVSAGDVLIQGPAQALGTALIAFARTFNGDVTDVTGHGTQVASVIGARGNNGLNIAGVCWQVQLMAVKIGGGPYPGSWWISDLVAGIDYVVARRLAGVNVRIMNLSGGHSVVLPAGNAEITAINAAAAQEILYVVAAGNNGVDIDAAGNNFFPCEYVPAPVDNIICVGASDNRDRLMVFPTWGSNWGTTSVDVAAPGADVLMLRRTNDATPPPASATIFSSGTSFAAPHVAGIAAQFWSLPGFAAHTVADIKTRILTGLNGPLGVPHPHGVDPRYGLQFPPGGAAPTGTVVSGINHDGRARMTMGDDFGDAPDGPYPTLLVDWGPRHEDIGEEWLGPDPAGDVSPEFDAFNAPLWPPDPDGVPNMVDSDALDDGVALIGPFAFSPPLPAPPNQATVRVFVRTENNPQADHDNGRYGVNGPNVNAYGHGPYDGVHGPMDNKFIWVNGFFDWNCSGDWTSNASEHVFSLRVDPSTWGPVNAGQYDITFNMPTRPPVFFGDEMYTRFRLDYGENLGQALAPPLFPVGPSAGGLVNFWDIPGLPFAPGAAVANLYESIPVIHPAHLDLANGLAQFGETEDYLPPMLGAACWQDDTCTECLPTECPDYYAGPLTQCTGMDCNGNGVDDFCDIASGSSCDCQPDGIPDECQLADGPDCNENGVPDNCDIGVEFGGYCFDPGVPCYPPECSSDWNHNGVPDECETCGDLNGDGQVDLDDYWIFVDAFGTCVGNPHYNPAADLDGDGCVTLVDFQAWRMCYKMANGEDFAIPKSKRMPPPSPKLLTLGAVR
jgi:subtilisin family serine protease